MFNGYVEADELPRSATALLIGDWECSTTSPMSKDVLQKLILSTCKIIAPGHRRQPNHFSNFTLCIGWKKAFRLSVSISFSAVFKMNMLDLANLLDNDGNMQNEMMVMAFAATLMSTIPVLLGNEFDVNVGK